MRNIYALVALTMVVGCGGGDGKDGRDGAQGAMGAAGPPGANGDDGDNGEPGADGMNGEDGAPGTNGTNGTNGTDGEPGADGSAILQGAGAPAAGLGVDGDIYIDTVSRDVYQKSNGTWSVVTNLSGGPAGPKGDKGDQGDPGTNGTDGTDGAAGASVLTGSGVPAAGLGKVGDVFIDSATGNLYTKGVGGWTVSGSLKGPAGDDGTDGTDGVDVKDTVGGVRWFAFALNDTFDDTPSLLTSQAHTDLSSSATFGFTGANQHGRLAFFTAGSFVAGGVNLVAYDFLNVSAAVTGGAVGNVNLYLTNGDNVFCEWNRTAAAGPNYSFDLWDPDNCENFSAGAGDFSLESVTGVQLGIRSSAAGSRTLTVTAISLVAN